jgi:mono/diheme cytochrome c family protein
LAERGNYLVNTIMACGNCHSPREANGQLILEKAFSGGLTFNTPAFVATAPNITPDPETGIGSWSDAEIKRALVEGMRPNHGRLAGVPLAAIMPANFYKALLPDDLDAIVAYLRTVKPVREPSRRPRLQGRDPPRLLSRRRNRFQHGHVRRSRQAGRLSHHHRPLHGVSFDMVARGFRFQGWPRPRRPGFPAARRGAGGNATKHRQQHHVG